MIRSQADRHLLKRLFDLTIDYRRIFWLAASLSLLLAPISVLRPYLVQIAVDDYIVTQDMTGLWTMIMLLVSVLFLEGFATYVFAFSTSLLGQSVIRDLRLRVFSHINSLRLSYFDRTPVGHSTTRSINDLETINSVFSEGVINIVADVLTLIFVLAMMFYHSWQLTLVCLLALPPLIWSAIWFKNAVKRAYETVRSQVAIMNAFLQERLTGMRVVQIFNTEAKEWAKFEQINQRYTQANIDSIFAYAVFFPIVEILSAASLGLMVWYGASSVLEGQVTLGVLVAFPLYLGMLFRPVRILADKFNALQMGMVAARRVFEVLDNRQVILDKGSLQPLKLQGHLRFEDVYFSYQQDASLEEIGQDWILKGLNFELEAGKTLAIVGSTGAGKSTIINLLSRFYEWQQGEITLDGRSLRDYPLAYLRKRIAVVLQDVFLFSGTVLENITLRDASINRQAVEEAAKMIGAHDFIMQLPNGYDYVVMERGATLSMGQRQLISFVRALVTNPDILILDEATSSIDPQTELVIQYAIERLIAKRTSIIIAHRLSTIRHAERILVMEQGRAKEWGSHAELMQLEEGHYRSLVETALRMAE